ncbi:TPA: hypothetical protein ACX6RC_002316 [Photobacterium damselae]
MGENNKALTKALEWVVEIDPPAVVASVKAEREKYPKLSNQELAEKAFSVARWKASSTGFVTGLPSNPWTAVPAATTDVAITLRTEVAAVARAAVIYDENFFDDEDAKWELLIPIFGMNVTSQFAREVGIRGGMGVTRAAIKKYLAKETLKKFKNIMLKYFGVKVTQKGIVTKTLPIVGGVIGGGWNYIEVGLVRKRTIAYFEGKEI